jgi:hypothetical protein
MMQLGDPAELRKILNKIVASQDPIYPHVAAHIDQIARHHREHAFADITIGLLLAINEINHTHNPDTEATTELIWRLMYAAAQLEKIRP